MSSKCDSFHVLRLLSILWGYELDFGTGGVMWTPVQPDPPSSHPVRQAGAETWKMHNISLIFTKVCDWRETCIPHFKNLRCPSVLLVSDSSRLAILTSLLYSSFWSSVKNAPKHTFKFLWSSVLLYLYICYLLILCSGYKEFTWTLELGYSLLIRHPINERAIDTC